MSTTWKEKLADKMPETWAREIDLFEGQMELKVAGKLEDKLFAEARLRRGSYGQRYDNGLRDDGTGQKKLAFPREIFKGPDTYFDAPGMLRIKNPYGKVTVEQMEVNSKVSSISGARIVAVSEFYVDSTSSAITRSARLLGRLPPMPIQATDGSLTIPFQL